MQTVLSLKGKSPLRRTLDLRANSYGYLSAVLYICRHGKNAHLMQTLAYCNEKIADCYLHAVNGQFSLWLNHAAFDVSAAEAKQIREKLEPLGLRIEKLDAAPAAAPIDTTAAVQA